MAYEILYNSKRGYTLEKTIEGEISFKKIPLKFKLNDSTAKFRQEILFNKLFT